MRPHGNAGEEWAIVLDNLLFFSFPQRSLLSWAQVLKGGLVDEVDFPEGNSRILCLLSAHLVLRT